MNVASLLVLVIVIALFVAAIRRLFKTKGGCAGCSHKGCQGCSACSSGSMYINATKKNTADKI